MENKEIMANEEVIETATTEVAKASSGFGAGVAKFGLGVIAGMIICKYVAEPIMAKVKAKKAEKDEEVIDVDNEDISFGSDDEDDSE